MPMKVKRKTHSTKHLWTKQEDAALVDCLVEISKDLAWKSENGFRTRYLLHLEKLIATKVPSSNLKATPHVELRYKLLKRQFHAINEMINHSSGFGHPVAVGLRNKEFPHLDDLMSVWGKDRATEVGAKTLADAVEDINLCDEETNTFEYEIDEYAEFHKDEEYVKEETKKSDMETQDSFCPSNNKATTRKKKKFDDVLGDLVGEISKYVTVITETNEEMKGISTYFKKQTENNDRKMRIYDELMELSDFLNKKLWMSRTPCSSNHLNGKLVIDFVEKNHNQRETIRINYALDSLTIEAHGSHLKVASLAHGRSTMSMHCKSQPQNEESMKLKPDFILLETKKAELPFSFIQRGPDGKGDMDWWNPPETHPCMPSELRCPVYFHSDKAFSGGQQLPCLTEVTEITDAKKACRHLSGTNADVRLRISGVGMLLCIQPAHGRT
ncbi:hypothetical protein ZIOFF_021420 [Zingiber officinale]|uniref:Myb/SANT-like domain-containing protein n=1 Tax=Zingiber officinale TaxID=94328 RepID=A0A8J5H1Q7_ZINOF|nr:hypothetical protein ZIOFF_021420 [Zingiber officinale]